MQGFSELAHIITKMRNIGIYIEPGYDGVYGKLTLFSQLQKNVGLAIVYESCRSNYRKN